MYTADASFTPVLGRGGEVVTTISVQRDITRELEVEARVQRALEMGAVGRLSASMAHDFNNMLTTINGFAAFMQPITNHELLDAAILVNREDNDGCATVTYQHAMHLCHVALDVIDLIGVVYGNTWQLELTEFD